MMKCFCFAFEINISQRLLKLIMDSLKPPFRKMLTYLNGMEYFSCLSIATTFVPPQHFSQVILWTLTRPLLKRSFCSAILKQISRCVWISVLLMSQFGPSFSWQTNWTNISIQLLLATWV